MIKAGSSGQAVGNMPNEIITDNTLARLFIEANKKIKDSENVEVSNLFEEKESIFSHATRAPDNLLRERIAKSIVNKKIFHEKLIASNVQSGLWNFFVYKIKLIFYPKTFVLNTAVVDISSIEWKYFSMYKKKWKQKTKTYLNDFYSYTELAFKDKTTFRNIIWGELFALIAGVLLSIFSIWIISLPSFNTMPIQPNINLFFLNWRMAVRYLSFASMIFICSPFMILLSMWFININHLQHSKNFHYFWITLAAIGMFILLISWINIFLYCWMINTSSFVI